MEKKVQTKSNNMTTGKEWKRLFVFALPIFLGQLLQQLYATADSIIVGNCVSTAALAAVGSCTVTTFVFNAFSLGMSNGGCTMVSQFFGAQDRERMCDGAAMLVRVLLVMGAACTLIGVGLARFFMEKIISVKDPEVAEAAILYFRIYSVGMVFTFLYNAEAAILRAVGDSKSLLVFLLISTLVNVALDLLFVAVFHWGIAGAAWATVLSQFVCLVVSLYYVYRNYPEFRFSVRELVKRDPEMLKICLRMGVPATIQMVVVSCGNLVMQRLINSFGTDTMAACTVGSRFEHYCSIPIFTFLQAMAAFTGQNVGANRLDRVKRGLRSCLLMDLIAVLVLSVAMYVLAPVLASLFGVEGVARQQAVEYMRWLALVYPIFSVYLPVNGVLQGAGDPLPAAADCLVALISRVGTAYLMAYAFHWDYSVCWLPIPVGWVCGMAVGYYYYFSGHWKKKSLVRHNVPAEKAGEE